MGQTLSKDELLYKQVSNGNIEGIKALHREGANLEWTDKEGKTPLMVACMNPELFDVAKTLLELGAKVNGYRPGCHAGTPLHYAAKRGLDQTVKLLLSHGANALVMNDDRQTPLNVAREKEYGNVARSIESHICLFSGWLRELYGPSYHEIAGPKWVSRKIWVVVIPCGCRNPTKRMKLELSIYPNMQDSKPRTNISLWKAEIEEPNFQMHDPVLIIFDKLTGTRHRLSAANEGDKQQLRWLYDACRGFSKVLRWPRPQSARNPVFPVTAPLSDAENLELKIGTSIQSAMEERPPLYPSPEMNNLEDHQSSIDNPRRSGWGSAGRPEPSFRASSSSGWLDNPAEGDYNGLGARGAEPSAKDTQNTDSRHLISDIVQTMHSILVPASSVPSAPPIPEEVVDDSPNHYPSVDTSSIDLSMPVEDNNPVTINELKDGGSPSLCVICLDAPLEGACIPCGHMAGCMSCLNQIETKQGVCPVCRAKIVQIIRIYAV